jgi:6-phosphogluconolactonase (cycloisomerase 2 family)
MGDQQSDRSASRHTVNQPGGATMRKCGPRRQLKQVIGVAVLALSGSVLAASPAFAAGFPGGPPGGPPFGPPGNQAVFVQTDNPSGNQVLAYHTSGNGQLVGPGTYNTGGDGAIAAGSAVDPLASQGSLTLADNGQILLAVNAGSDTVSVFDVQGSGLWLSAVVPSGGQFPSSIAAHGNLVYVLNAGGAGSIQGFIVSDRGLRAIPGSNRSLGLSNTTPPFFLDAPGQVGFTPDGQKVIVVTKDSGSDIDVFPLGPFGVPSAPPVVTAAAAPIPFGFTFNSWGDLVVTEAGASDLTSYAVNRDGSLTMIGTAGDGQGALCWVTGDNGYFYGSNAGSANVSQFSENSSGAPQLVGVAASTGSGATDSAASSDGRFLYVEEGGAGTVYEFQVGAGGSLTQIGELTGLAAPMEGIAAT